MIVPNITLDKKGDLKDLGLDFQRRLDAVESARDELMEQTWKLALQFYEGKIPPTHWPWPNASSAHVPLIPTHCDVFQSKLYNAATAHSPVYYLFPRAQGDVVPETELSPGVSINTFTKGMQKISEWIESNKVNHDEAFEEITTLLPKYGDAFVLITYEHDFVAKIKHQSVDGKVTPVKVGKRDLIDSVVYHVVHAKNVYMPIRERDPQRSPWVGLDRTFTVDQIRQKIEAEEWYKENGEAVLSYEQQLTAKELKKKKRSGYFVRTSDGRELTKDELDQEQLRLAKVNEVEDSPDRIAFAHVFARLDTDMDGMPEEVNFIIHRPTGRIVSLRHNHWAHMQRPVEHLYFIMREGVWTSIGAAEMLFNVQEIVNDVMRDILNHNQIKNTSILVAKDNGTVDEKTAIYPMRLLLLEDPDDFQVRPLGVGGTPSASYNDLSFLVGWAERRDGISDHTLGREKTARTSPTTMLALMEAGNERIERITSRMKKTQARMWYQTLVLFMQNGIDERVLDRILSEEEKAAVLTVWDTLDSDEIRDWVVIEPRVSSNDYSRSVRRQETMTLYGQIEVVFGRLFALVQAYRQFMGGQPDPMTGLPTPPDPVMLELLKQMASGLHRLMHRILQTYDEKDDRDLNPDVLKLLKEVESSVQGIPGLQAPNPFQDVRDNERSDQVQQATGNSKNTEGSSGAEVASGRPAAGQPRLPE